MHKQRIHYLDMLRILATLGVIAIHVSSQQPFYISNLRTNSWIGLNFWDAINRFSVPIFVMISGILFLNPECTVDMHKIFTRNILRIVTAFIFWDIFYALYTYFFVDHRLKMLLTLLFRGYSHLWFLPMIIGLYLIIPFLRKITTDKKLTEYFLILALIFSILIPSFYRTYYALAPYHHFSFMVQLIVHNVQKVTDSFYFNFTLFFSTYYVAGYYFSEIKLNKQLRWLIYALGLIGFGLTFGFTNFISLHYNKPILPFYDFMSLPVACTSLAVFIAFKELGKKIDWNKESVAKKLLLNISNLTFGIYLIHFLFVKILTNNLRLFEVIPNTFVAVPVATIIIFIVSAAIMKLVSYVPWLNRHIM